jgi:hypothetical protein
MLINMHGSVDEICSNRHGTELKIGTFSTDMTFSPDTYDPNKADTCRPRKWSRVELFFSPRDIPIIREFFEGRLTP